MVIVQLNLKLIQLILLAKYYGLKQWCDVTINRYTNIDNL